MHLQNSQHGRWVCLLVTGLLALCTSIFILRPRTGNNTEDSKTSLRLEFHPDQQSTFKFKILQIADIHLGEDSWTDWGPQQDVKTFRVLDSVILAERPDLIVLSGDQLTANNVDQNATAYYRLLGERLSYYGTPWALIFGNHDDAPLESQLSNGTIVKFKSKTSRQQLLSVEKEFPLSLTQSNPGIFGSSNYALDIHYPSAPDIRTQTDDIAFQLFFLDSGGGSLPQQLEQNQIDWFQKTHRSDLLGAAVFQHIPTTDFVYKDGCCHGLHDNEVDTIVSDPGIVQVLQDSQNVKWLGVGHIHGSDYCCSTSGSPDLHLCFGRHSGYGGYGHWDRGARIYELELEASSDKLSLNWRSYVRMENRTIIDPYEPTLNQVR